MIHWNAELARRLTCTESEREAIDPAIRRILALAAGFGSGGAATLVRLAKESGDPLLEIGATLVAEGVPKETLENILATYLAVSDESGLPFVLACISAEGLVGIAEGDDLSLLIRKLVAYRSAGGALELLETLERTVQAPGAAHEASLPEMPGNRAVPWSDDAPYGGPER